MTRGRPVFRDFLDREGFQAAVDRAAARLPPALRRALTRIEIVVDEKPDPALLRQPGGGRLPPTILGLFSGTAFPEKSVFNSFEWPARIYLFRRNILRECRNPQQVEDEVFDTLVHELGHALGLSEEDLENRGLG